MYWGIQRTVWGQGLCSGSYRGQSGDRVGSVGHKEDSPGTGLVQWVIQRTVRGQGWFSGSYRGQSEDRVCAVGHTEDSLGTGLVQWESMGHIEDRLRPSPVSIACCRPGARPTRHPHMSCCNSRPWDGWRPPHTVARRWWSVVSLCGAGVWSLSL